MAKLEPDEIKCESYGPKDLCSGCGGDGYHNHIGDCLYSLRNRIDELEKKEPKK